MHLREKCKMQLIAQILVHGILMKTMEIQVYFFDEN
jgi:hypothetical protein